MNKPVGIITRNLPPLSVHHYESYLPTAFDESMTLLQKVNKVIEYLHQYGNTTNDMLTKWNEVYKWVMEDGLTIAVLDKMDVMLSDGTFERLINQTLFGQLNADIEKVEKDFVTLTNSINQTIQNSVKKTSERFGFNNRTIELNYTNGLLIDVKETDENNILVTQSVLTYESEMLSKVVQTYGKEQLTQSLNYTDGVLSSVKNELGVL